MLHATFNTRPRVYDGSQRLFLLTIRLANEAPPVKHDLTGWCYEDSSARDE
jgi:hypothetical protein